MPTFNGKEFSTNTTAGTISGSFIAGSGSEVTPYDYRVTFTSATTFEVQRYDGDQPIDAVIAGTIPPTNFQLDGMDWDFSSGPFAAGDRHLIQPTRDAAASMTVSMSQPEKLALASPIRVERELNNRGNATVSIDSIYDTDPATSDFTLPGGYDVNGPAEVRINAAGDYEIYDGLGALMATAPAASAGQQLFANAVPALTPGYEINIDGDVQEGDVFTMGEIHQVHHAEKVFQKALAKPDDLGPEAPGQVEARGGIKVPDRTVYAGHAAGGQRHHGVGHVHAVALRPPQGGAALRARAAVPARPRALQRPGGHQARAEQRRAGAEPRVPARVLWPHDARELPRVPARPAQVQHPGQHPPGRRGVQEVERLPDPGQAHPAL